METKNIIEKLKELVKKGNVSKIVVRRKGEVLLNVPVNVGVVGAVVGLAAAKWAVLAAVLGTLRRAPRSQGRGRQGRQPGQGRLSGGRQGGEGGGRRLRVCGGRFRAQGLSPAGQAGANSRADKRERNSRKTK